MKPSVVTFRISRIFKNLIQNDFVVEHKTFDDVSIYTLGREGKHYIALNYGEINNFKALLNSPKFHHSRMISHVYARFATNNGVKYLSESMLFKTYNTKNIPDLAIWFNNEQYFLEVELNLKSKDRIEKKLVNYSKNFANSHIIYISDNPHIRSSILKYQGIAKAVKSLSAYGLKEITSTNNSLVENILGIQRGVTNA